MRESINMWQCISKMGSVESKMKGGYHSPFPLFNSLGAYNSDKQFPSFKSDQIKSCPRNYSTTVTVMRDSSPIPAKVSPPPPKKKKRRRRRGRRKGKGQQKPPERQRQLSTNSEDSFIICFEEGGNCQISDLSDDETFEDLYSSDSTVAQKKVRFADELCEVHPMVMWAFAYKSARKGPWEVYARDRERFHKRVVSVEAEIGHVFEPEHRMRIFNERFA